MTDPPSLLARLEPGRRQKISFLILLSQGLREFGGQAQFKCLEGMRFWSFSERTVQIFACYVHALGISSCGRDIPVSVFTNGCIFRSFMVAIWCAMRSNLSLLLHWWDNASVLSMDSLWWSDFNADVQGSDRCRVGELQGTRVK